MNAHWVKWVSVVALAVAGTLGVACGDDDDDDTNPGKSGSAGKAGTGGAAGGGSGGSAGGGAGGSAGGVSGAGGAGGVVNRAPPRGSVAALQMAIDTRKYTEKESGDPADGGKTKWNCYDDPNDADLAHKAAVNPGKNRICANFKLAELKFDDYKAKGWPTDAAAMKEVRDADDKIVEWVYYVKDEGDKGWYWLKVKAKGDKGAETIDATSAQPDGYKVTGCEGCHGMGNKEFVRAGDAVPRGTNMKTAPAPIP